MINFYRKYKVLCIFLSLIIVLFVFSFTVFYGKSDLFKFPFDVDIWGTVSDWAIVFLTFTSGLLILQTLKAQVNSNRISQDNFRQSILPNFHISDEIYADEIGHYFTMSLKKNRALNFVLHGNTAITGFIDKNKLYPLMNVNEGENIKVYTNSNRVVKWEKVLQTPIITFTFSDIAGNKYEQSIIVHISRGHLSLSDPVLNNN